MKFHRPRPRWILLAAVGLAILGAGLGVGRPASQQWQAIHMIERRGGKTIADNAPPAWLPGWCRDRVADLFVNVWSVDLADTEASDADLWLVGRLPGLRVLNLDGTQITDAGLIRLERCDQLRHLNLSRTKITDAGLESITGMTNLQQLYLSETAISDAALSRIRGLKAIEVLDLMNTGVTDAGLDHLRRMAGLRRLDVYGTRVTDRGIGELRKVLPKTGVFIRRSASPE